MGRPDAALVGMAAALVFGAAAGCALMFGLEAATPALVVAAIALVSVLATRPARGATQLPALEERLDEIEAAIVEARQERHKMRMQAETAGRFREEFVAAVRHELKTPLNAILGFSDVLLQDVDGPLEPGQRESVEQIRSAGGYLSELVDAVLSEWTPDRQTPAPLAPLDTEAVFERVTRLLEGQRRERDVELGWDVPDGFIAPTVDERRLLQVLINLGTNALRATRRGSVRFEAVNAPGEAQLRVIDTGQGIPPRALETIFSAYEQAGPGDGGSGLGLAIAKELVEWHGGELSVRSERGVGSTFTVHLPRED